MIVPEGWEYPRADHLFSKVSDKNHPEEELLSATQENGVLPRSMLPARVTMPTGNLESFKLVQPDDFIISLRSFQGGIEHSKYRGLVSPAYTVIRSQVDISNDFYRHYFKSERLLNDLKSSIIGIRDGKQISFGVFRSIKLPYPPLPEQKKIAAILSSIDETIQATRETIEQTKKVKQGLMQELLTRGIGHTWFKKTEIGEIPEGWTAKRLGDICVDKGLQTGPFGSQLHSHEYTANGIPVVMPKDISHGIISHETPARIPEERASLLAKHLLLTGDILFPRRGDLGRCALVSSQENGWICGTGCLRARLCRGVLPEYVIQYIAYPRTMKWLNENAVGQTMLNLNTGIIGSMPVILPPLEEQREIADIICSVDNYIQSVESNLCQLQSLKKGLMQDLLSGKVRVAI